MSEAGGLFRPPVLVLRAGMPTIQRNTSRAHFMNRAVRATAITLVLLTATVACAQPGGPSAPDPATLRGDSTQTRKRLAEAEQKLIGGKAADAADDLQRLIDESGDDLINLDGNGKEYRSARWVAHALLAQLPPDVRKAYQDRIDQPAK